MKKKKISALVLSGGSMHCAWGAGALTALAEGSPEYRPDIVVAASGSVGGTLYYLSRQAQKIPHVWISLVPRSNVIRKISYPIIDAQELAFKVMQKGSPLSFVKLQNSFKHTRLFVPLTRIRDGRTVYVQAKADSSVYDLVCAAASVPLVSGLGATYRGEQYVDGDFGTQTSDLVRESLRLGATNITVINNSPPRDSLGRVFNWLLIHGARALGYKALSKTFARELKKERLVRMQKGVAIRILSPSKPLRYSKIGKSHLANRTMFNQGYEDYIKSLTPRPRG